MFIDTIEPIQGFNQISEAASAGKDDNEEDGLSFKSIFSDAVNDYVNAENQVSRDITDLSTGESDDLHNLMINIQKSQLSLDLVIQLRNKALDAYNEIMRMGV